MVLSSFVWFDHLQLLGLGPVYWGEDSVYGGYIGLVLVSSPTPTTATKQGHYLLTLFPPLLTERFGSPVFEVITSV